MGAGAGQSSRATQRNATSNFDTRSCVTIVWGCYTHMHTQHCSAKRTNTARAFLTPQLMTQPDDGDNNLEKDRA